MGVGGPASRQASTEATAGQPGGPPQQQLRGPSPKTASTRTGSSPRPTHSSAISSNAAAPAATSGPASATVTATANYQAICSPTTAPENGMVITTTGLPGHSPLPALSERPLACTASPPTSHSRRHRPKMTHLNARQEGHAVSSTRPSPKHHHKETPGPQRKPAPRAVPGQHEARQSTEAPQRRQPPRAQPAPPTQPLPTTTPRLHRRRPPGTGSDNYHWRQEWPEQQQRVAASASSIPSSEALARLGLPRLPTATSATPATPHWRTSWRSVVGAPY